MFIYTQYNFHTTGYCQSFLPPQPCLPPAAAGVFPKENTLPVEAALVTDGNAMVGLLAAPPNEKLAVVVWA